MSRRVLLPAFILLSALFLRLFRLGHKGLWLDEACSITFARLGWHPFVELMWRKEGNMVLYYLFLRGWRHLGESEALLRGLSVVFALAAIPALYLLGRRLFGPGAALISALLLAVNACHIAYAQEARSYALLIFLCTVSTLYFVKSIESPTWTHWSLYALATVLALYSHFFAGLLMAAQWLSLFFLPRHAVPWRKSLTTLSAIAVLIAPAVLFMLTKDQGQIDYKPHPGIAVLYGLLVFLTAWNGTIPGILLFTIYLSFFVASSVVFYRMWSRDGRTLETWHCALAFTWFAFPIAADIMISHLGKEMFYNRYFLICQPAWILLVAWGLSRLPREAVRQATVGVTVLLSLAAVFHYYAKPKEDWRAVVRSLSAEACPGDVVLSYPPFADSPIEYYKRRMNLDGRNFSLVLISNSSLSSIMEILPPPSHAVWLLLYHRDDGVARSLQTALNARYHRAGEQRVADPLLLKFGEDANQDPSR